MFKAIIQISNIRFSKSINAFLYFLKKIPPIKFLLKDINYTFLGFKSILSTLSIIYKIISTPIKSAFLFLLAIFLPVFLIFDGNVDADKILSLIFAFYILLNFVFSSLLSTNEESFIIVKQMKMPPRKYFHSTLFFDKSLDFLSKSLIFSIFFKFLDFNFIFGIKLAFIILSTNIISESIYLYLFTKKDLNKIKNQTIITSIKVIVYALIVVLGYLLALLFKPKIYFNFIHFFFTNNILFSIFIVIFIYSLVYIYKYENYWDVINYNNTIEDFKELNVSLSEANFAGIKLDEKNYTSEDLHTSKFDDKQGYDYLNAIFFERHKKILYQPMRIKSAIILVVFLAVFLINIFIDSISGKEIINLIINNYTFFVFFIYLLSNSETIVKSLFYNCDKSLLKYGFYKQGDALLKTFVLRLKKIVFSNIVPILILCLCLVIITFIYTPSNIINIIPVLLFIIVLSLFFSVHYIFMYYIFQPYTSDLKVKNPFFNIINFLVYFISYMSLQINAPAKIFLPISIVIAIIYILIALTLVYKKAPKTFRIK